MELDLSGDLVRYASRFVAAHESADLPGMTSIRVEPHEQGAVIVATDRHWMIICIDKDGFCDEPLNFDPAVVTQMKLDQRDGLRVRANKKLGLRIYDGKTQVFAQPGWLAEEQDYPDWRNTVPDHKSMSVHTPAIIGPHYLVQIGRLLDQGELRQTHIIFMGTNAASKVIAYVPELPHIMIVGMPLGGDVPKPRSDWSAAFKQEAPEVDDDL